jgi:mono/diheme cytochrome c family protein
MMRTAAWAVLAASLIVLSGFVAWAQDDEAVRSRGRLLLATNCSRCHAIDRTGKSPHPQAPPFRILGQRYPIESLAESLAEGLFTGHPDMPEFVFEVDDIRAILAYLESIQEPKAR